MTPLGKIVSVCMSSITETVGWEGKDFSSNEAALFRKSPVVGALESPSEGWFCL